MTSRLALWATVAAIVAGTTAGASAQTYEVTKLVPGSAFHGVHGLGIDKSGRLFAGSVAARPMAPWRGRPSSPAISIRARATDR